MSAPPARGSGGAGVPDRGPGIREDAPVLVRVEAELEAAPARVWGLLVDVGRWPRLHPAVSFAALRGDPAPGTHLHWRADGMRIASIVCEAEEPRRLGWTLRTLGGRGYQRWTLEPLAAGGTRVRLEESWSGLLASLLRRTLRRTLELSRSRWLEGLRGAAEEVAAEYSSDADADRGLDGAIQALLEGNRRWASELSAEDPRAFDELARVHRPPFLFVGCCDARKPLDVITGAAPGDLFLHRNVANQVQLDDPAVGASLEFALGTLGVRHLVVCGHTRCGGIQAALGPDPGGDLGRWIAPVRALAALRSRELGEIRDPSERADRLAELNVIVQIGNALRHPAVRARLEDPPRPLGIHGWLFRLETGRIETVELPWERWREEGLL